MVNIAEESSLICSDCFYDEGLKLDAEYIGYLSEAECKHAIVFRERN